MAETIPEETTSTENEIYNKVNEYANEMLDFERQIFLDAVEKDGLFISAKGLLMDTVILNLLKVYCDPGNLVIVLNSSDAEEKFYTEKLNNPDVHTSNYHQATNSREEFYLNGGIHFVTTRILVVDFLKNRIPIEKITGMVVLRAHNILESCQEAFALRLYRQKNKTGFVKAFSHCAQSFTLGFGQVERVMRTVFVKELYLWPRFHSIVIGDLKKYEPTVIELHIPISESMKDIQTCLLELMNYTVKELKRLNKCLDLEEITVENCLIKKFHKILQVQLDSVWYQLSSKTKQLVADLKTLRHLMVSLIHNDVVSYYSLVTKFMTAEQEIRTNWVGLDIADHFFANSKRLIYKGNPVNKELNPQECSKWEALNEILKQDIPEDFKALREKYSIDSRVKVLILCHDSRTCAQLQQVLTHGPQKYLFFQVMKHRIPFLKITPNFVNRLPSTSDDNDVEKTVLEQKMAEILTMYESITPKKPKKADNVDVSINPNDLNAILENINEDESEEEIKSSYLLTLSTAAIDGSHANETMGNSSQITLEPCPELEKIDLAAIENENPLVYIQTFKDQTKHYSLKETLTEMRPNYIIMYHSEMAAIRQIELYEAKNQRQRPLKVYFLIHSGTVEEQSYLTTLRREKQAFEFLIETKSKMVVPDYQDGKSEDCLLLQRERAIIEENTRKGGIDPESVPVIPRIIVDMREFRSELPALIHRRGIEIDPITISVGDYVLTPDICVERKSISDLIQSLNSGRLYQQCVQMFRYYSKPMLLIEFDQNKPFQLQSHFIVSSDSTASCNDIQQKLQLLTLHFPKLKLIWSPSPYATAQLFEELKEGKEQPNIEYAVSISGEDDMDIIERKYNSVVYDFVQKLPGINARNIHTFLRRAKSLDYVITLSEEELAEILDNPFDAKLLYSVIHEVHRAETVEGTSSTATTEHDSLKKSGNAKWKIKNKFRFNKK